MAIVQVSRITQRKGLQEDLPQPLASAELGWAIDQRRLFIGNGTTEEGAPIVGNTEILTEFSDILAFTTAYTYKGEAAGYTAQTGSSPGSPVTQSLQRRLDSFVVVTDFGATGDGVTDDTVAINRALNQLYCVQVNPQVRRSLFFPAGTYKISSTILIPPYARLYGDGADASILMFTIDVWTSGTAYAEGVVVKEVDLSGDADYYLSVAPVPALVNGNPVPLYDTDYWQLTSLPTYAFRSSDNLLQTGSNIGLNSATAPQYIEVEGVALATAELPTPGSLGHNLLLLDRVNNSEFNQVSFYGPMSATDVAATIPSNPLESITLIGVDSAPSLPVKSVTFDQCSFHNATYAFNTNQLTQGVTVSNSDFDTLYRGIVLGDSAPVNGGPTGFRIMHNVFDNIFLEGVIIDTCGLNATGYNVFYDVANQFGGVANPAAAVILINADNNISVGDMFQRTDTYSTTYPRIQLWNQSTSSIPASIASTSGGAIQLGSFQRQTGQQATLTDNLVSQTLFTIDATQAVSTGGFASFRMDYTIYRDTTATKAVRTGTMVVCGSPGNDSAGEVLVFTDDYVENENTDVTLNASEDIGDLITVSYTTAATGYDGTIFYSISSLG